LLGIYIIRNDIFNRAQNQIKNDLKFAEMVYNEEIESVKRAFSLVKYFNKENIKNLKETISLDYLFVVDVKDKNKVRSEIVLKAFETGKGVGGTRKIEKEELIEMGREIYERIRIPLRETKYSEPTEKKECENALAMGYAMPIVDKNGIVKKVVYGGKILNRDTYIVDKIRDFVFENRLYKSKPIGTVTIFLDDIRISTNVIDNEGNRAIGTRVSKIVKEAVLEKGGVWFHKAFVVTDWYLTAYKPIRDINNKIIGMLYVGTLLQPFIDLTKKIVLIFSIIILIGFILTIIISFVLATSISNKIMVLVKATDIYAAGNFDYRIPANFSIKEFNNLANEFNEMAEKIKERKANLKISNERLNGLNKNYLDLISFVSHELKGILSSTILNAYSVRDGFLGMINFKQRKALDSITRNLDYLAATVKNFLNLSRLEKGELLVNKQIVNLSEDIIEPTIEAFIKEANEKEMEIINTIERGYKINVDFDLMRIVFNNLIGNGVKYGAKRGKIIIRKKEIEGGKIEIEVYNDGQPIEVDQIDRLFKKFSRIITESTKKVRGTGLGLYITKEIIEKHNGSIYVKPRKEGNSFIFNIERGL